MMNDRLMMYGRFSLGIMGFVLLLAGTTVPALATGLADGVWQGEGGPETFVFQFSRVEGEWQGLIHTLSDGIKLTELPVRRVTYQHPDLVLEFAHGPTYEGTVDLETGTIDGAILVDGELSGQMPLQRVDPATIPQLDAGLGQYRDTPYRYRVPGENGDRWSTGSAEGTALPPAALEGLVRGILDGQAGVLHAVLVAVDGRLVLEEYFHGSHADYLHGVASVTKSVASLLVGIAVDRGDIADLDTPLPLFFPHCALQDPEGWNGATLRHLLTMSLGLDWSAQEMQGLHGTGQEFFCRVLGRGFAHPPGSTWNYVNADVDLLAGILDEATGRQADDYAGEFFFQPLGITRWDWEYMKQDGYPLLDGSLRLRARDMLTIGQLMLEGGALDGVRVISQEWVQASMSPQIETGQPEGYGYLWWIFRPPLGGRTLDIPAANGWGSQFILVIPELNAVIVTQGGNQDNGKHMAVAGLLARCLGGE